MGKPTAQPTWKRVNTWLGHIVFGLPALLAVPALLATAARFGWWDTLTTGVPAAAWACIPLLLWAVYVREGRARRTVWVLLLAIASGVLLLSPIHFWAGPAVVVLLLEATRRLTPSRRQRRSPSRWLARRPGRRDDPGTDLAPRTPDTITAPEAGQS